LSITIKAFPLIKLYFQIKERKEKKERKKERKEGRKEGRKEEVCLNVYKRCKKGSEKLKKKMSK
jgi:hypothetical protein